MHNQECEILVVGAGPAGTMAAAITSQAGCKTILLDRKFVVGAPVKCAEYIPIQLAGEVPFTKDCIAQSIAGMKTFIAGKLDDINKARGYMIHREIFDQSLLDNSIDSGTTFINNSDFMSLKTDGTAVIRNRADGSTFQISPKIIIGADGPGSRVADAAGFITGVNIPGVQYTLPLLNQEDYTEVHFEKDFFGGYGWFFPKNDVVNIGLGMNRQGGNTTSLKSTLDNFVGKFVE
jgi:digeranylgeranylglycerophospholipid reductase